jgi:hypothetical protein
MQRYVFKKKSEFLPVEYFIGDGKMGNPVRSFFKFTYFCVFNSNLTMYATGQTS